MRRWALIVLPLLVLAATGCGTGAPPSPAGPAPAPPAAASAAAAPTTGYAAADALYRQMRPGLNLPAGVTFPDHLPQATGPYQQNAGLVTAQNFWLCAWLWSWLDSGSSKSRAQAAAAELVKYNLMDAYTKALDGSGRRAVDGAIRAAQSGSRPAVQSFTQSTCGGPFFGQAQPATE